MPELGEEQQRRHPGDDLGRDQRDQHQHVRRPAPSEPRPDQPEARAVPSIGRAAIVTAAISTWRERLAQDGSSKKSGTMRAEPVKCWSDLLELNENRITSDDRREQDEKTQAPNAGAKRALVEAWPRGAVPAPRPRPRGPRSAGRSPSARQESIIATVNAGRRASSGPRGTAAGSGCRSCRSRPAEQLRAHEVADRGQEDQHAAAEDALLGLRQRHVQERLQRVP